MIVRVSRHALKRYRERVRDVPEIDAWVALSAPAIRLAAQFGAKYVRLGTGQRVVIEGGVIVTVLPAGVWPETLRMKGPRDA